jgi:hypothetical protein
VTHGLSMDSCLHRNDKIEVLGVLGGKNVKQTQSVFDRDFDATGLVRIAFCVVHIARMN